jgi:hypothetical protein
MSREAEGEIGAIFARLKDEIRRSSTALHGDSAGLSSRPLAGRAQAERAWAVTAERPFEQAPTRGGRVQAWVFVPVKRVLRKLMRWYVEPLAAQQRSFNLAILNLVDELADRVEADVSRLERRLESLERRLAPDGDEPGG